MNPSVENKIESVPAQEPVMVPAQDPVEEPAQEPVKVQDQEPAEKVVPITLSALPSNLLYDINTSSYRFSTVKTRSNPLAASNNSIITFCHEADNTMKQYIVKFSENAAYSKRVRRIELETLRILEGLDGRALNLLHTADTDTFYITIFSEILSVVSLAAFLNGAQLPESDIKPVLHSLVVAVTELRDRGLCYGNLDPELLLIQLSTRKVILTDLSAAFPWTDRTLRHHELRCSGVLCPPEAGSDMGVTCDGLTVWQLGIIMAQLMKVDIWEMLAASWSLNPAVLGVAGWSIFCVQFLESCLSVDPKERRKFRTMSQNLWLEHTEEELFSLGLDCKFPFDL